MESYGIRFRCSGSDPLDVQLGAMVVGQGSLQHALSTHERPKMHSEKEACGSQFGVKPSNLHGSQFGFIVVVILVLAQ